MSWNKKELKKIKGVPLDTLRGIMNECVSVGTVMTCFWCFFVIMFSMNLFMVWCKFFCCQFYILLYGYCSSEIYVTMLFTHDQLILFYLMSAWSVKSMFISMLVNLYDEFLCYNLQWYFIVIFINDWCFF